MTYDVAIAGGGTAGCVLAARLSEDPTRSVCLVEAGPDYGPRTSGAWPDDLLDPRSFTFTHDWGGGGEDGRSLGARVIGGCSTHNACMAVVGTPADYDEWGPEWGCGRFAPYLARAREMLRVARANTDTPAPFHVAFLEAAAELGFPLLDDPDDPARPVGHASLPVNVVEVTRWNTAFAYLDAARERPNLTILGDTPVDRLAMADDRARGVVTAAGETIEAGLVVLTAGAYFTPAILLRSGIGPEEELRRHGIPLLAPLPVGEELLDHHGAGIGWETTPLFTELAADHVRRTGRLFRPHGFVKAASSACAPGSWDIHLIPWANEGETPGTFEASVGVFHLKPRSAGRVRLASRDPAALPQVERGFLREPSDLETVVEGLELARSLAEQPSLRRLLAAESAPGAEPLDAYASRTMRNYFHPAGTCGIGRVVDTRGRVLGIEGLVVADASVMPTIPRANTNLTTVAIAERLAETI
ncbi:MAG TPA: GMC family oxidoreductase [Gaiella sp.]